MGRIFLTTTLSIFLLCGLSGTAHANKSFWDVLSTMFEEEEGKEPDPSETLQAPFAYDPNRKITRDDTLPENAIPIHLPHRTSDEIGQWTMGIVSEVMSIKAGQAKQEFDLEKQYFKPKAETQFQKFLIDTTIQDVINSGRYDLSSFVQGKPLLLNEGSSGKHYRWLFEVPVMVSYIEKKDFDYKTQTPVNQDITLTLQVGRVPDGGGKDGIKIEIWEGKVEAVRR